MPIPSAKNVAHSFAEGDPLAAARWVKYAAENPDFSVPAVFKDIAGVTDEAALKGYAAPFPDRTFLGGPMSFPLMFPIMPHHRADVEENDRVWSALSDLSIPVLTAFSDGDPVTRGHEQKFQDRIAGAKGIEHITIKDAGHYLQEQQPGLLAKAVIQFIGKID